MPRFQNQDSATKLLFWSVIGVNLIILPSVSLDGINTPKLFILGLAGSVSLILLINIFRSDTSFLRSPQAIAVMALVSVSVASLIVSGRPQEQFFGVFGRNTGLLAIISLSSLYLLSSLIRSHELISKLSSALLVSGSLALIYGLIQVLGIDPVDWQPTGYTKIFGFLGNPNFQSAYLGMFGSLLVAYLLKKEYGKLVRVLSFIGIFLSVLVIHVSESVQGFLVLMAGFCVNLVIFANSLNKKKLLFAVSSFSGISFLAAMSGMLNYGPLSNLLYKDSIQFRGDYWRTAIKIGTENPMFGVGIDRFGENYRLYRDQIATTRRGPDVTSNSPHNVFLDFLSNSGFLAFFLYLGLHLITAAAVIRYLRGVKNVSAPYMGLTAAWVAYVAQSIISVNQLGLAIWGWVLMGALLGYSLLGSVEQKPLTRLEYKNNVSTKKSREVISAGLLLSLIIGAGIGGTISVMPLYRQVNVLSALKSGDPVKIEAQAYASPESAYVMFTLASIFSSNGLNEESLRVNRAAVKAFPNTYELWNLLSIQPGATELELKTSKMRMKALDPLNPTLK